MLQAGGGSSVVESSEEGPEPVLAPLEFVLTPPSVAVGVPVGSVSWVVVSLELAASVDPVDPSKPRSTRELQPSIVAHAAPNTQQKPHRGTLATPDLDTRDTEEW